jgi:hypothetical protein
MAWRVVPDDEIPGSLIVCYMDLRPGREGQRAPFLFRLKEDARTATRDGARAAAVSSAMAATSIVPVGAACPVWKSGPVKASYDGQVIQWQIITSTNGPAVDTAGHKGVVVSNSIIHHKGGPGVHIDGPYFTMVDTVITSDDRATQNIECSNTGEIWLNDITVIDGSTGIYFGKCCHFMLNRVRSPQFWWTRHQFGCPYLSTPCFRQLGLKRR